MRLRLGLWFAVATCLAGGLLAGSGCSSSSNRAPTDAGGSDDAGGHDAIAEAVAADASDAGALGCHPIDVSGFQPPAYIGPHASSLACNGFNGDGGLVQSYRDSCLDLGATYGSCAALAVPDAGSAACYGCLVTPENPGASSAGVVATVGTVVVVNYAACIELVDPTDAGVSCAHALSAGAACVEYACKSTCPITDDVSLAAFVACTNEASSGACVGYVFPADLCIATEQGDGGTAVAKICFAGNDAQEHYLSFAHYLCGGS
jgi:hypothetical protein